MKIQQLLPRNAIQAIVEARLMGAPAVTPLGARQVGKTTLAALVGESWPGKTTVLDLERPVIREALATAPERMLGDLEWKCSEAPRSSRSMHVALADLKLDHLWVVYPGSLRYPIADRMTVLPLREVDTLPLTPD